MAATRQDDLAKPDQPKKIAGMTREQMAPMEREMAPMEWEMASLHQDFKQIERYLAQHHAELLDEFRSVIAATSLDQTGVNV